ncbi:uncharacterized protein LOC124375180, partial [Homalodisca vitripennis]|uniref:uncharacterized protein LOC124375180 n=1 Tax=Homalodisca vitripennis TaxID=197043 RepID=UPI001EEA0290
LDGIGLTDQPHESGCGQVSKHAVADRIKQGEENTAGLAQQGWPRVTKQQLALLRNQIAGPAIGTASAAAIGKTIIAANNTQSATAAKPFVQTPLSVQELVVAAGGSQVVARAATPGPSASPQRIATTTVVTTIAQAPATMTTKGEAGRSDASVRGRNGGTDEASGCECGGRGSGEQDWWTDPCSDTSPGGGCKHRGPGKWLPW